MYGWILLCGVDVWLHTIFIAIHQDCPTFWLELNTGISDAESVLVFAQPISHSASNSVWVESNHTTTLHFRFGILNVVDQSQAQYVDHSSENNVLYVILDTADQSHNRYQDGADHVDHIFTSQVIHKISQLEVVPFVTSHFHALPVCTGNAFCQVALVQSVWRNFQALPGWLGSAVLSDTVKSV